MNQYIKILSFLALGSILSFSSCKRGDDLYVSPNAPVEVTPALLLTAIEVSTFNSYEGNLIKDASILMQQNTGVDGQALPINNYILAENEFDNQWAQLYQALYNCNDLQTRYGDVNPYYSGIADVMFALNLGLATDMWGDVPFTEALQGKNNYMAKYDSQEDVMKGILAMLDGAIVKMQEPESANELLPGADDLFFYDKNAPVLSIQMGHWIKVAYSLKARYQNRLSNTSLYSASDVLASLSKGIASSNDDLITKHGDASTEFNQWYDFQNNRQNYILASSTFVDSFKLRPTDARLEAYFAEYDTLGIVGSPMDNPVPEASAWGNYLAGGSSTGVRILSFTEMKFIEAEVKARTSDPTATDALNAAIMESCSTVTNGSYTGGDIAVYTAANTDISRIIYEKWLALFGSAEPYNDYRRTGFPALGINPSGRINVIPKRYPTPQNERVSNTNAPTPALTDKVWFAL